MVRNSLPTHSIRNGKTGEVVATEIHDSVDAIAKAQALGKKAKAPMIVFSERQIFEYNPTKEFDFEI